MLAHASRKTFENSKGELQLTWGWSTIFLGLLDTGFLTAFALGLVALGPYSDLYDPVLVVGPALIFAGVLTLNFALSYKYLDIHSEGYFFVTFSLLGLVHSFTFPSSVKIVGNWFDPSTAGWVFGLWASSTPVGNIVGALVVLICEATNLEVEWNLLIPAFAVFLVGLVIIPAIKSDPESARLPNPEAITAYEKYLREPTSGDGTTTEDPTTKQTSLEKPASIRSEPAPVSPRHKKTGGYNFAPVDPNAPRTSSRGSSVPDAGIEDEEKEEAPEAQVEKVTEAALERHNSQNQLLKKQPKPSARSDSRLVDYSKTRMSKTERAYKESYENLGFWKRLTYGIWLPGVMIWSVSFALIKAVNYTIFSWLPFYLVQLGFDTATSNWISMLYDIGFMIGGIAAGYWSDRLGGKRAIPTYVFLVMAVIPIAVLGNGYTNEIFLCFVCAICGIFVGGPTSLISTAVAHDLTKQNALKLNNQAVATVVGIVDGFGTLGAAITQIIVAWASEQYSWRTVFYMLSIYLVVSMLFLYRIFIQEYDDYIERMEAEAREKLPPPRKGHLLETPSRTSLPTQARSVSMLSPSERPSRLSTRFEVATSLR